MVDPIANPTPPVNDAERQRLETEKRTRDADAQRDAEAVRTRQAAGLEQPEALKAEEKSLTKEEQALDTDREARRIRYGGQTNKPTDVHLDPANTAAAKLRAFEDDRFGEDCVRINDQIEKGSGSPYAEMSDADKLHYTAMERLVVAEQKFNDATALAAQAEADMAAAQEHLEACEKEAEESRAKADEQAKARQARLDAREKEKAAKQPQPAKV